MLAFPLHFADLKAECTPFSWPLEKVFPIMGTVPGNREMPVLGNTCNE